MNQFDQQIEDYLRGRLGADEKAAFEAAMALDPQLRADVELVREAIRHLDGRRLRLLVVLALAGLPVQDPSFLKKTGWKLLAVGLPLAVAALFFLNKNGWREAAPVPPPYWSVLADTVTASFMNSAVALDGKAYFTGGTTTQFVDRDPYNSTLHILDFATGEVVRAAGGLSEGRCYMTATAFGGKVYFAGGHRWAPGGAGYQIFDNVDIYDVATGTWSLAHLSQPRTGGAAVVVGGKLLFAGGGVPSDVPYAPTPSDVVDILDPTTGQWSVAHLSLARSGLSAAAVGNRAWFCGGIPTADQSTCTNRVDMYDATTGRWSIDSLSLARSEMAAVAAGPYLICAGGLLDTVGKSDHIDILDTRNGKWSVAALSAPRCGIAGAAVGKKAYFTGGGNLNPSVFMDASENTVDIFDSETGAWSTDRLVNNRMAHACAAWGNKMAVFGGWRAEQATTTGSVELLTDRSLGPGLAPTGSSVQLSPNPASDRLTVSLSEKSGLSGPASLVVTDASGRELLRKALEINELPYSLDVSGLRPGLYYLHLETGGGRTRPGLFEVAR